MKAQLWSQAIRKIRRRWDRWMDEALADRVNAYITTLGLFVALAALGASAAALYITYRQTTIAETQMEIMRRQLKQTSNLNIEILQAFNAPAVSAFHANIRNPGVVPMEIARVELTYRSDNYEMECREKPESDTLKTSAFTKGPYPPGTFPMKSVAFIKQWTAAPESNQYLFQCYVSRSGPAQPGEAWFLRWDIHTTDQRIFSSRPSGDFTVPAGLIREGFPK